MASIFPWQHEAWQQLQQLRERLPHALLFHGAAGIGKADFLLDFAQTLLCENTTPPQHGCGACPSCTWFLQQSHPDFRLVRPEALDDDTGGGGEEGGDADTNKKSAKAAKAPSKEIKIEQIRALADFMGVSTHRRGLRVVMLYPAEALNIHASNALLKTLEEPPPGTVFLLATNSVERLLPTILSRCRKFAMPIPTHASALAWLREQGLAHADSLLREQGGAPLAALAQAQAGERDMLDVLLQMLAAPGVDGALRVAETLAKTPLPVLVGWQQRWLYDVFSFKLSGKLRYYPRCQRDIAALADNIGTASLMQAIKDTNGRRAVADHPLSPKLFIEDMLLDYVACCA